MFKTTLYIYDNTYDVDPGPTYIIDWIIQYDLEQNNNLKCNP